MATVKKNFNTFQTDSSIKLTDNFVGFANTNFNGERKWTFDSIIKNINSKSQSAVKAWVQYDINDSQWIIRSSFNVASVTKGIHPTYPSWNREVSIINFITPMESNDYAVVASFNFYNPSSNIYNNYWSTLWPVNAMPYNKSSCRLYHYDSASYSKSYPYIISAIIIGNQDQ